MDQNPGLPPFEDVVRRHGPAVLRVCRAAVGPTDADDAWSETFLSALRSYPSLDPSTNLEAWLVTVAHRRCVDLVRREARLVPVGAGPDAVGLGAAGPHPTPLSGPAPRPTDPALIVTDASVWSAVAALPDRQRLALAYHHLGGLPFPLVAEIIGGTPEAVRRAASDGIRTLRSRLAEGEL